MKPKYVLPKKPLSPKTPMVIVPKEKLTYDSAIFWGIGAELVLVSFQFILLALYHYRNPGTQLTFSSNYMMSHGFYIFLIPGFILFATIVFFLMRKYEISSASYLFVFLLAAGAIEITFYLTIEARYQGPFLYSVLDKIIGTALGVIGYYAIGKKEHTV